MPLYSRKDMPQVNTQNLGKALGMTKRKAKVTKGMSLAIKLKQSQKELIKSKVKGVAAKYSKPTDMKPLIISKDGYIIDGHHRWAAAIYKFGKDVQIPTHTIHLKKDEAIELYNLKMDVSEKKNLVLKNEEKKQELLRELKDWQKSTRAPIPTEKNPAYRK